MAEIRYSGLPSRYTKGIGDKLTESWADFALAKAPQKLIMGGIESIPTSAAGEAAKKQQALQKLFADLQKAQDDLQKAQNALNAFRAGSTGTTK